MAAAKKPIEGKATTTEETPAEEVYAEKVAALERASAEKATIGRPPQRKQLQRIPQQRHFHPPKR